MEQRQIPGSPHIRRKRTLWIIAGALLLGLLVGLGAVIPTIQVGNEVADLAWCRGPENIDSTYNPEEGIAKLGGSKRAARKLSFYLWLPRQLIPHREEATMLLGACGKPGLAPLLKASRDADPRIRAAAMRGLGAEQLRSEADSSVPVLLVALQEKDPEIRISAMFSLYFIGRAGQPAAPLLLAIARNGSGEEQQRAVRALGRVGPASPEILALLTGMLTDKSKTWFVASALGNLGPGAKGSVPDLVKSLDGADRPTKECIAEALGKIGPDAGEAVGSLGGLLRERSAKDPSDPFARQVRWQAARALSRIGPAAVLVLHKALTDPDEDARRNAAWALGEMGDAAQEALPAIEGLLQDRDMVVRLEAARTLIRLDRGNKKIAPALIAALGDANLGVRASAAETLAQAGPSAQPAVAALQKALEDKESLMRVAAAEALLRIGHNSTPLVPVLIDALDEENLWSTRERAARALGEIGPAARAAIPALKKMLKEHNVRDAAAEALKKISS